MKKFKDLINEVTTSWFLPMVKEKFNEFSKSPQFELFNNQLLNVNKAEYDLETNKVFSDIRLLDSYGDIVSYAKMNKLNLTNNLDSTKLQETIMQGGLKSLPKILVKIQLGYVCQISEQFFDEIRMWLDKLGRDTDLSELKLEDLKYLLHVSLSKLINELKAGVNNRKDVLDEIGEEMNELGSMNSKLTDKRNDFTIIKIYFTKLKKQFFDGLKTGGFADFETSSNLPTNLAQNAQELEIANIKVNQMEFILDFASKIEQQLKENKKTV